MMKYLTTAATIAAYTMVSAPVYADGHALTLRATANSNENDEDYDGLIVFKNYVEAASNGAIEVDIFMGTQICATGAECLEGVSEGSIDIYVSTSGGAAGIFPYVQVLDLPYLMSDDRVAEAVLQGDFVRTMRDMALETSDDTIRLMTIGNTGGWRNFANTVRPIMTPADMEGLKIRTVVADLPQELVRALGASPTPIPWPELFTSFQTGVVEGSKNGITDIMGMKFPDAGLQYVTLDGHAYMGALWWMNNEQFMGLDEANRRVVMDGFYALQQATFASPKRIWGSTRCRPVRAYWKSNCCSGDRPPFGTHATILGVLYRPVFHERDPAYGPQTPSSVSTLFHWPPCFRRNTPAGSIALF